MDDQVRSPRITKPRRRHATAFKDQVLGECRQPGVSVASVALKHGINQNLIYRWRRASHDDFLRLPAPLNAMTIEAPTADPQDTVRIDLPSPSGPITVHWPVGLLERSTDWLKALMR